MPSGGILRPYGAAMGYPRDRESFCYIFFVYAKEFLSFMAEKLKIIPLGGLNEIGKNMTVY